MLHGYQKDRLTAFLHPTGNPSKRGLPAEPVDDRHRLRREDRPRRPRHTDEATTSCPSTTPTSSSRSWRALGFAGAALVLSLYALLIWRGLRTLTIAKNLFGALIAGGVVAMLLFQVFVNVGMTVGIMPITGIPLPLMSYGGSSVITTFLAVGLLQSIYAQGRASAATKGRVLGF